MGFKEWFKGSPQESQPKPRTSEEREAGRRVEKQRDTEKAVAEDRVRQEQYEKEKAAWPKTREQYSENNKKLLTEIQHIIGQIESTQKDLRKNLDRADSTAPHHHGAEQGSSRQKELLNAQKELQGLANINQRNLDLLKAEKHRLEIEVVGNKMKLESKDQYYGFAEEKAA